MKKDVWFEGRINRREYLARGTVCLGLILLALVPVFLRIVEVGRIVTPRSVPEELFPVPLIVIACMISFGYLLPASVRRLHDFGRSGWWLFGFVVLDNILKPMLGKGGVLIWKTVFNLLLLLWPGTKGPNEYGEAPRFEVRKLMGRRFAMVLAVIYVLEAALCGWAIVERRAREEAAKLPIPQAEVESMLANLARTNEIGNYERFNQRMDGHRLTLTNLTVRTVYGKGRGWKEVACKTEEGVNVLLYVPAQVMDTLSRDLIDEDRISRVEGGALASLEGLNKFDLARPRQGNAILLEAAQIDVSWKIEQLPTIDLAVSGDELVLLLREHKNRLSPIQIDELQRRLSGRRLTFTGMQLRSCGGANDFINSADFAFSDISLQLSVELQPITQKKFDSLKLKTLTGTVAKESANDSYGDRALRLTEGEVK